MKINFLPKRLHESSRTYFYLEVGRMQQSHGSKDKFYGRYKFRKKEDFLYLVGSSKHMVPETTILKGLIDLDKGRLGGEKCKWK